MERGGEAAVLSVLSDKTFFLFYRRCRVAASVKNAVSTINTLYKNGEELAPRLTPVDTYTY